jgi:hypothetical protein
LGFNLSKTFENHLKHLMTQFSTGISLDNLESGCKSARAGVVGFEPKKRVEKSPAFPFFLWGGPVLSTYDTAVHLMI